MTQQKESNRDLIPLKYNYFLSFKPLKTTSTEVKIEVNSVFFFTYFGYS